MIGGKQTEYDDHDMEEGEDHNKEWKNKKIDHKSDSSDNDHHELHKDKSLTQKKRPPIIESDEDEMEEEVEDMDGGNLGNNKNKKEEEEEENEEEEIYCICRTSDIDRFMM